MRAPSTRNQTHPPDTPDQELQIEPRAITKAGVAQETEYAEQEVGDPLLVVRRPLYVPVPTASLNH